MVADFRPCKASGSLFGHESWSACPSLPGHIHSHLASLLRVLPLLSLVTWHTAGSILGGGPENAPVRTPPAAPGPEEDRCLQAALPQAELSPSAPYPSSPHPFCRGLALVHHAPVVQEQYLRMSWLLVWRKPRLPWGKVQVALPTSTCRPCGGGLGGVDRWAAGSSLRQAVPGHRVALPLCALLASPPLPPSGLPAPQKPLPHPFLTTDC